MSMVFFSVTVSLDGFMAPEWHSDGTVFHYVNDGIESALRQAREAAGGRDVRIAGGVHTIQQYLRAGLVDEFHLAVAPVFLGAGMRLFERMESVPGELEIQEAVHSPRVVHLRYRVARR